ncbi:cytochrome P450 [Dendrothele bispora CBS 962.96]|uniref:Cytochrome P450 n=1 Tax=Dendrothele bispora (strain CBS 962.96) TaxID=1314807 RepID=A0A4S8MCK3_DENBC|nr:cytochrome P450 [Dendrothele bispora CBS 962.96]
MSITEYLFHPLAWRSYLISGSSVLALIVCAIIAFQGLKRQKVSMPPSPSGLPVFGNIFQIPLKFQWYRFTEWKNIYGPIFSLHIPGKTIVVLNNHKIAHDLLVLRSDIYSDRTQLSMVNLMTNKFAMPVMPYGERWKRMRQIAHTNLNVAAVKKYRLFHEREAQNLVQNILQDPISWNAHFTRSISSAVRSSVYGLPSMNSNQDPAISEISGFLEDVIHMCLPFSNAIDIFPALELLPMWMSKWKKIGKRSFDKSTALFRKYLAYTRDNIDTEEVQASVGANVLAAETEDKLPEIETVWLAGLLLTAGIHTTISSLSVFMLAMCLYPNIQKRAQEEIERVVGRGRLPRLDDDLPYIHCLVAETLRWFPVGPIGLPRRCEKDNYYNGYLIPEDSIIIPNIWAMNRDKDIYGSDAESFLPDRFLDEMDQPSFQFQDAKQHGHNTFGFGKRICIGLNMANQSLFINMASILWAFNISNAETLNGQPITSFERNFVKDDGITAQPMPFKCKISPRKAVIDVMSDI